MIVSGVRIVSLVQDACLASAMKVCGKDMTVEDVLEEVLKDKVFYKSDGGLTLSGGEVLLQPDFFGGAFESMQGERSQHGH